MEATLGGYGPVEKAYHLCRRRRLVRLRHLVKPAQAKVDSEEHVLYFAFFVGLLFCSRMVLGILEVEAGCVRLCWMEGNTV